jgi:thioredoxin-dependent peroxiredoxin
VSLDDYRGKNSVVVYFYPRDFSKGCTAEACEFRDSYEEFKKLGAEVIGISGDSLQSHEAFAREHRLPFILLSDPDGSVRKAYGVRKSLGLIPGRVSFLIDKMGIVRHVFSSQTKATAHVSEAIEVLKSLP